MDDLDLFASAAPGLAPIVERELRQLGVQSLTTTPDGVAFSGDLAMLAEANRRLRAANRVLVRFTRFRARTFAELERHAARADWRRFARPEVPVTFRITTRKSRLYHSTAIAARLTRALLDAVPRARVLDAAESPNAQMFVVRFVRDQCEISADSSGAHLHRRGYRQAIGKAPLRETLAAAMLLAVDWRGESSLIDPFCGSGTIPIEAALIALDRPPGLNREFAFMHWNEWESQPSESWRVSAATVEGRDVPAILGFDRDAGAITSSKTNAARADVGRLTQFARQAISDLQPPAARGWIVTNPPYGLRVGDRAELRDLYARFGAVLRERCAGWNVAMLSADRSLEKATKLPLEMVLRTTNGGVPVRLMAGEV